MNNNEVITIVLNKTYLQVGRNKVMAQGLATTMKQHLNWEQE